MVELPKGVIEWVRSTFSACNRRITEKLCMSPNSPEESFDLTWIEHLSRYASPIELESGWIVKIESHFLGGRRHFYSWEIADIGVLVHLRLGDQGRTSKVALLQSKRLYPEATPVREETRSDYEIGFARLADPEDASLSLRLAGDFRFTQDSRYGALRYGSDQGKAIDAYMTDVGLKVYYQLYNPWSVPYTQRIPLERYEPPEGLPELGTRVIPASLLHRLLKDSENPVPALRDLASVPSLPQFGWRLEDFVCDEVLSCREGDQYSSLQDERIFALFNRRSGPIAAAIAISIEAPSDAT